MSDWTRNRRANDQIAAIGTVSVQLLSVATKTMLLIDGLSGLWIPAHSLRVYPGCSKDDHQKSAYHKTVHEVSFHRMTRVGTATLWTIAWDALPNNIRSSL